MSNKAQVIDFDRMITNFQGAPLKIEGDQVVTLKYAAVTALLSTDDRAMAGAEKFARYRLAKKIFEDGVVSLEPSQVQKVKQAIGQTFVPMIVGAAWDLIDQKQIEQKAEEPAQLSNEEEHA